MSPGQVLEASQKLGRRIAVVHAPLAFQGRGTILSIVLWAVCGWGALPAAPVGAGSIEVLYHDSIRPGASKVGIQFLSRSEGWLGIKGATNGSGKPTDPQVLRTETGLPGFFPVTSLHLPPNYLLDYLFFLDQVHGWVVIRKPDASQQLRLFATKDGGQTWTEAGGNPPRGGVATLQFLTPFLGWLLTPTELWRTADGGTTWQPLRTPGPPGFRRLALLNDHVGVVAGWGGIYYTDDGGASWSRRYRPKPDPKLYLYGVHFPTASDGWAVGDDRHLLHTADGGRKWRRVRVAHPRMGPFDVFTSVHFLSRRVGVVAGAHDMREGVPPAVLRKTSPIAFDYVRPYLLATFDAGHTWAYYDTPIPVGTWTQADPTTLFGINWRFIPAQAGIVEVKIKD